MKLPTTRAGITAMIAKMRRHRDYIPRTIPGDGRKFPAPESFHHRCLIEFQSPLTTVNNVMDPDVDYPEFSFSSRSLTDWYVSEFNRLNHLTIGA
jgi:hypothetical protein